SLTQVVHYSAGLVSEHLTKSAFSGSLDVIQASERGVWPIKVGILARVCRASVGRPTFAFNEVVIDLRAVILILALNANTFLSVCAHLVVPDSVVPPRHLFFFDPVYRPP
ncbi:hypothetical protein, partial [Salmonella enterica]|uniref:hypothetical protein n=1 Tax=Salmonella enterica TaxID=28901 RepID=UPI00398C6DA5